MRGHGVGRVESVDERGFGVAFGGDEGSVVIPADGLGTLVRPLVDPTEARRWVEVHTAEPTGERVAGPRSHHHYRRASRDERLAMLQVYFRDRGALETIREALRVMVEGGTLSILDGAVLEDPELGADEVERLRREDPYGDRGVCFGTGGDGEHELLCRGPKSARTAIVIRF